MNQESSCQPVNMIAQLTSFASISSSTQTTVSPTSIVVLLTPTHTRECAGSLLKLWREHGLYSDSKPSERASTAHTRHLDTREHTDTPHSRWNDCTWTVKFINRTS